MQELNYYYILDFTKGCCDIFSGPSFESEYDVEDYLIGLGYELDNIQYMITEQLSYNIENEPKKILDEDDYQFEDE